MGREGDDKWESTIIQAKGKEKGRCGMGGGNGRGVTRKFDIMEWGDGVSGNWEVRYHLKCKRIISNKNMLVLLF